MKVQINNRFVLLVSFGLLFLWGSVGFAADPLLTDLYKERAATIEKISRLREKGQQDSEQLLPRHREYLLFQGSINFAEYDKTLSDLHQSLKKTEGQIIDILRRNNLPDPEWVSQKKQEAIYTGAPLLSFYRPLAAEYARGKALPVAGPLFLLILLGGIAAIFLYKKTRKAFPKERGLIYPCLLTQRENHVFEPIFIPFSAGMTRS
ncbi:MAG: Loki-CTERM sorting domain-containing protein [Nitrospirota bacterium]